MMQAFPLIADSRTSGQKIPTLYYDLRFIIVFTNTQDYTLSCNS
jgi:hypothetical protein